VRPVDAHEREQHASICDEWEAAGAAGVKGLR